MLDFTALWAKDFPMILRKLISTFLIQALLLTSINAYVPQHLQENPDTAATTVFLMNEDRKPRCQLTPEAAELLSLEELQGLAQNDTLTVVARNTSANELRPCDGNDIIHAELPSWLAWAIGAIPLAYYLFRVYPVLDATKPSQKLMKKAYTPAELEALCSQGPRLCAKIKDRLYFIDKSFVFSYDSNYRVKRYAARAAQEIVNYKDTLTVLNKFSKTVGFVGIGNRRGIILNRPFDSDIKSISSNGSTLLALTKKGTVWAFRDSPDKIQMTITETTVDPMLGPFFHREATIDGRRVNFKRVDLPAKAINIHVKKGDIVIELENHSSAILDETSGKLQCKTLAGQILTPRP